MSDTNGEDDLEQILNSEIEEGKHLKADLESRRKQVKQASRRNERIGRAIDKIKPKDDHIPFVATHTVRDAFQVTSELLRSFSRLKWCYIVDTESGRRLVSFWISRSAYHVDAAAFTDEVGEEVSAAIGLVADISKHETRAARVVRYVREHWVASSIAILAALASFLSHIDTIVEFSTGYIAPAQVKVLAADSTNVTQGSFQLPVQLENHSVLGTAVPEIVSVSLEDSAGNPVSNNLFEFVNPGLLKSIPPLDTQPVLIKGVVREPGIFEIVLNGNSSPKFSSQKNTFQSRTQLVVWNKGGVIELGDPQSLRILRGGKACSIPVEARLGVTFENGFEGEAIIERVANVQFYGASIDFNAGDPISTQGAEVTKIEFSTSKTFLMHQTFRFNLRLKTVDDTILKKSEWEAMLPKIQLKKLSQLVVKTGGET